MYSRINFRSSHERRGIFFRRQFRKRPPWDRHNFLGGRFYDLPLFLTYIKQALDAWFTFVLAVQNVL